MNTGAKIALGFGITALLVGGGVGIYFLVKKKDEDTDTGTTETTKSDSKIADATQKVKDTTDLVEAGKGLADALGIKIGKNDGEKVSADGKQSHIVIQKNGMLKKVN